MERYARNLPRDVFMHLLMMASLYAAVGAFIALLFQYVNAAFPDALRGYYYPGLLDTVRRSEAILIIAFPLYLVLARLAERGMARAPALREFKLRKWLIYLTLFISAVTIAVDLVVLVYNFLGGELTLPFVLKVGAVLATAGPVFGYYLWDVRREAGVVSGAPRLAAAAVSAAALVALAAGFFIVGSPAVQRDRRFDLERIRHLQAIQSAVVNYWMSKEKLPDTPDALHDDIRGFAAPRDPKTGVPYEYRATGDMSFELCAGFATEGGQWEDGYLSFENGAPVSIPARVYVYEGKTPIPRQNDNWRHGAGRVCFSRAIDPDIYKPRKIPHPYEIGSPSEHRLMCITAVARIKN